jgi:uncharacterized OB-fold protein
MVHKCIDCGRIIDSSRVYCKKCEREAKERIAEKEHLMTKKKKSFSDGLYN